VSTRADRRRVGTGAACEDFVTDIECCEEIGRVHAEFLADVRPVATMVEVRRPIDPRLLVEVELTARIPVDETGPTEESADGPVRS